MSSVSDYANTVQPIESIILKGYGLSTKGRVIVAPESNTAMAKDLVQIDNYALIGNRDGVTTLDELRLYLATISKADSFHEIYTDTIRPAIIREISAMESQLNFSSVTKKLPIHPIYDNIQDIRDYAQVNTLMLYLLENPKVLLSPEENTLLTFSANLKGNDNPQPEKELAELIVQLKALPAGQIEKSSLLFNKLLYFAEALLSRIPDSNKMVYMNKLMLNKLYLGVVYPNSDQPIFADGKELQTPYDLFTAPKGSRIATCEELSYLGKVLCDAVSLPSAPVDITYLLNQRMNIKIGGYNISAPLQSKHMFLKVWIDNQAYNYDATITSGTADWYNIKSFSKYEDIYQRNSFYYKVLDDISTCSGYYQNISITLLNRDSQNIRSTGKSIYGPQMAKNMELGFVLDPLFANEDFYGIYLDVLYLGKNFTPITFSKYFYQLYGNYPHTYKYFMDKIAAFNIYSFTMIDMYYFLTADIKPVQLYIDKISKLIKVDDTGNQFLVEPK